MVDFLTDFLQSLRDDSDPEKTPSYEGKDPRIQQTPWCAACHSRPATGLLCCSRCHTAWYCNSNCQREHYKYGHKEACLLQLAIPLRNMQQDSDEEPENFFETQIGAFDLFDETQTYMTAREGLVGAYVAAANSAEIKKVSMKRLFFHALEIQRLDVIGPLGLRKMTPFILLSLHRDDDAFDYIRYWMETDVTNEDTVSTLMHRHTGTKEGEWIYPRVKHSRFLDIFEECPDLSEQLAPLTFFLALLIIKLRIVATYDATYGSIDLAFGTSGGQMIYEVQDAVKEMLIDESLVNINSQRQQVERLVDGIHRRNAFMLPSLLNPEPLLKIGLQGNLRGGLDEAAFACLSGARCFLRVPGAKALLEQRFGKKSVL